MRPLLDDLELPTVQEIKTRDQRMLAEHKPPGMNGSQLQNLGRQPTSVMLCGVATGPTALEFVEQLDFKFRAQQPVRFVADIVADAHIETMHIRDLNIQEVAGKPQKYAYLLSLCEFIVPTEPDDAPPTEDETPESPAEQIDQQVGTLIIEVNVEGGTNFDFASVNVVARQTQTDGTPLSKNLANRENNSWTEQDFPAGDFTVEATASASSPITASATTTVQPGATSHVSLTLNPGVVIAHAFVVHFRFDKALIEPCMRPVMRQVAQHVKDNPKQKLLIVGHTDKTGPSNYNQSLSERRARAAFAYLTFGNDNTASQAEWNELRKQRPTGTSTSVNDTWGAFEYQYILQDLGLYPGNLDGDHGELTDTAVEAFRCQVGLPPGTDVDDPTWEALIREYMKRDNLTVDNDRFFTNCAPEILKWIGCGEERPLTIWGTPPRGTAWRPYRRVEFLFVEATQLPCQVPQPDTFNLPTAGSVANGWCIGPTTPAPPHGCPITYDRPSAAQQSSVWWVQPVESRGLNVQGTIRFEGFAPGTQIRFRYVLIASDGEFIDGELGSGEPRGRSVSGQIQADGTFEHSFQHADKPTGVYTLDIRGAFVVRLAGEPLAAATGSVVCKRLASDDRFDVIVTARQPITVDPQIQLASPIVVVRKPHTNPARQAVTLRVDYPFCHGNGEFTRSSNRIRFFTAATGGTEITFDGIDNVFAGAQLAAGVELFADSDQVSAAMDDVVLTLTLTTTAGATGPPIGAPATATMTAVELTLDIAISRIAPGIDPPALPVLDKINTGRFLQLRDPANIHERAMLIVRQAQPTAFAGNLTLTTPNAQIAIFAIETPAAGQTALPLPVTIANGAVPTTGARFFVEGADVSVALRDSSIRLGISGVEEVADRVAITVLPDPSRAGNFSVGEHEYTEGDEGSFLLPRPGTIVENANIIDPIPAGAPTISVRRRAVVRYPADAGGNNVPVSTRQASYPLIVILHGNHRRFLDDGTTFVQSYRGHEYIARHLASHGYIAITIDVDDINALPNGIFHRGAAILEHIQVMANRNTTPPAVPGIVNFTGKIDLTQIGLVGHSRGAEGVVAAQNINVVKAVGRNIRGIVSIAPTDGNTLTHSTTPYLVMIGSSDGDVSGESPFALYDRAAPPKSLVFVHGAIHNRFSTNADWLSPVSIDNDDDRMISEVDHHNIANGYITAFFEHHFRARLGFVAFFKHYHRPATTNRLELHQALQDTVRRVVDNFNQPAGGATLPAQLAARATTNTLLRAVTPTGLVLPSPSLVGPFVNPLTETQLTGTFLQFFVDLGEGGLIAWDAVSAAYQSALGGIDVSSFAVVAFRVTQRLGSPRNPNGILKDFSVRLTDTATPSQSATVRTSSVTSIPFPFVRHDHAAVHGLPPPASRVRFFDRRPDSPLLSKCVMKTIRLSLDSFKSDNAQLNLSALQSLQLIFDQTPTGEIVIDDIEFSN